MPFYKFLNIILLFFCSLNFFFGNSHEKKDINDNVLNGKMFVYHLIKA